MTNLPQTRGSLLLRLRDRSDEDAWREFGQIYRPVILRYARGKGMQQEDAEDLAQQVLLAVSRAVERWEVDARRASFRTWLHRVTHNLLINAVTRGAVVRGSGDSGVQWLLDQQPAAEHPDSDLLQLEYRRELFRWAARQIRREFQPATWQAFWATAVHNRRVEEVAAEQRKSRGAVYAARSRVMRRLRQKIAELDEEQ